ncbi:MAG: aldo/keto reductase [Lentisphaeria bacterium]|nr:aldo/keto reductase [Lentisphaeria bacterium]
MTAMFSKVMLGTVQFGMKYGVANTSGKPSYEAVRGILKEAFDNGITALDTAPEYGDSEDVIGRALAELGLAGRFRIVTKIPMLPQEGDQESFIRESLQSSMKRLGVEVIDGALFHKESDGVRLDLLKKMKDEGLIRCAGVSLNTLACRDGGQDADCLQVPCNMLDHRFDHCFGKAGRHCFVRGAYLQGMLLMPEEKIFIPEIREKRRRLEALGMPMAELSLRYLFAKPGENSILTGVENLDQLRENIRIARMAPLSQSEIAEVEKIVLPPLDEMLVSPWMWKKYRELHHIV